MHIAASRSSSQRNIRVTLAAAVHQALDEHDKEKLGLHARGGQKMGPENSDSADAMQHCTVDLAPVWMMRVSDGFTETSHRLECQAASWRHSSMLLLEVADAGGTHRPIAHRAPCCSEIASGRGRNRGVGQGWTDTLGGEIAVSA